MPPVPLLTWEQLTLHLRNPFRLSYGVSETRQAFWVRLQDDAGWGEGTIPPYYGVEPQAMTEFWDTAARRAAAPFPDDLDAVEAWMGDDGPAPARCALELALLDRIARRRQLPLWKLLNLPDPAPQPTSFTIAIDTPGAMAQMARDLAQFPVLKVKLGGDGQDEDRLAAIRAARPEARLRIDANAGWTLDQARRLVPRLAEYRLELIEQPLARSAIPEMGVLQAETSIPIVADESVQTVADVVRLAEAGVRGINVKIMKAGGLLAALRLIHLARACDLRVMLGCMVETSLGTTAMAHLMGLGEWLDLDAPLLISNDPFAGLTYDDGARVVVPDQPGIGVVFRPAAG